MVGVVVLLFTVISVMGTGSLWSAGTWGQGRKGGTVLGC